MSPTTITQSGMMLGLGESPAEVIETMDDLRTSGCQILTIGQYLAPSKKHHPVIRYIHPDEFEDYCIEALRRGFIGVDCGPFVRSSYKAEKLYNLSIAAKKYNLSE
jgi:lipoyl synthase